MNDLSGIYVPKDYEDLYTHYIAGTGNSLGQTLVRRFVPGEPPETREDLLQDVYLRMITKDVLKIFDPAKSNFGGVVYFVTRTVCVNFLKRKGHDPITNLKKATLAECAETEDYERGVIYLDRLESEEDGPECLMRGLDAQRKVNLLKREVALVTGIGEGGGIVASYRTAGVREKSRAVRLYRLMDYLMQGYSLEECAQKEGVTISTIYNWCWYLREIAGNIDE